MSVSSLPEWKQLLLEKKRREEEERERREKEEEEKLASMPAWKRGIIQRRKAKQDCFGDREKDICLLQVDVRSPSDGLSDMDSSVTVNLGSEPSLSPDTGLWLDADPKPVSEVSVETIVPVHENPFIRTQSVWKERGNEVDVKEREKDRLNPMGQDGESGRGRNIELKIERYRDLSEGRERDMSRDRSQGRERENNREASEKDKGPWKESVRDAAKERDFLKVRKDEEEKETEPTGSFSPLPCLRTIRADNIIIIEQERKGSDERRGRWREAERERPEEDQQGKRGMKMDLREILAGGGSVTEIRASEVLIIQPPASSEERNPGGGGAREEGEMKCTVDGRRESVGRELRTNISWQRDKDKETAKEKERPCGQATVIKDDRKDTLDDNVFVERGGRVSQLLSKFGEHPKPPSRSKSSDNFLRPGRRKYSGDHNDQQNEDRRAGERNMLMKGLPKRSFSFSDRVVSTRENGLDEDQYYERKMHERIHSDKRVAPWMDVAGLRKETTAKIKMGCARFLDKDRFGKRREGQLKNEDAEAEMWILHRNEVKKVELVDKRAAEKAGDADGDEGFTVASVKNTEGISFARRVPIRQDGKTKAADRDLDMGGQIEPQSCDKKVSDFQREEGFDNTIASETLQNYVTGASAEPASSCHTAEGQYRHASAFTECSSLLCTVVERGAEWRGTGPSGLHQGHSVLSQHTEDLITKIEKIGDTTVYINEKGERTYRAAYEITQESKHEGQVYSENLVHDITPRSPKKTASVGIPAGPLEIEIPRTVFYIGEEMSERKKAAGQSEEGQDVGGGQGVERRDSWRIGKPLSRIESLREKIRQRELERLRQRELQDGEGSEGAEASDGEGAGDRYEDRGTEIEWEAAHKRKRLVETERGQEDAAAQKSLATAADVTQEVGVLKTCPQLPVSVAHSQVDTTEEVTSGAATAAAEVISDSFQTSEDEDDPQEHVEEQLRRHRSRLQSREEESDEEAKELSEEEEKDYFSSLDPAQSLPSPTHPNSLAAMSRIYNLETVGSRSGLCMRDKPVDIPSVHLVKVKPIISNAQQADSKGLSGEDICGVQSIQRQIEQFQLNVTSTSPNTSRNDRDVKGQQSPKRVLKHHLKDDVKIQEKDQQTSESNPKVSPQRVCSPAPQLKQSNQTITIGSSILRSQSPDSFLKPSDGAPTPASSPCSPSPAQSPSISPSPTPSPTLFSIRSASGGQVKRGATITITPKKPAGGGGGGGGGGRMAGSTTGSTTSGSTTSKIPLQQTHTTSTVSEPARKRYPAVEDIVVIGGYLNLEKSCLVKSKGTPKRGKVYFDEDQLEQVCEYPSETSMLASTPYPHDQGRNDRLQGEEAQEEEGGSVLSKSTRNVGITTGRGLKVGQCHPLLKKHSV